MYHDRAWASAVGVMDGPGAGRLERCTEQDCSSCSPTVSRLVTRMAETVPGDTCNARSHKVGTEVSEEPGGRRKLWAEGKGLRSYKARHGGTKETEAGGCCEF